MEKQPETTNDGILKFVKSVESYRKKPDAAPKESEAPKESAVVDPERLDSLFKKTMGTSFDPNSKMYRDKREALTKMLASDPTLLEKSDTQVALEFYRRAK
jgi:hypothetical protein